MTHTAPDGAGTATPSGGATGGLDVNALREAIRDEYTAVAAEPGRGFHFHSGRPLARRLG